MQNRISYFLLFIFFLFAFSACTKYPEGPLVSLRSKQNRITGGWQAEYFEVNGNDSTSALPRDPLNSNMPCYYTFCPCGEDAKSKTIMGACANGKWDFKNGSKDILVIDIDGTSVYEYPFVQMDITEWSIIRLTNKEMWLKTDVSNNEYFVKYKKIEN